MKVSHLPCLCLWVALLPLAGSLKAEIASVPPAPAAISENDNSGWRNLFENNNFSKWARLDGSEVSSGWLGGWRIDEGIVERHGLLAGDIETKEVYGDFELRFEWKISKRGNSGVIYRQKDGKGLEYQVLDDKRHSDGRLPSHRAASLYDLVAAPVEKPLRPAGLWNRGKIVVRGTILEHWLNGQRVVRMDMDSDEWARHVSESKFEGRPNFGREASPILFQDHLDKVWFREVWIRDI